MRLTYEFETAHDIYGMRLDATGNPIDTVPFVITQEAASQDNPQVVWNGTNWLVLFESYDLSGTGYYYQKSLEAVRVSPTGQVLDLAPIKIRGVSPSGLAWAAASDGTDWVIVFQASDSSSAISFLRITAAGVLVQPPKTIVSSTYYSRFNLRLVYAAGVYLFTWTDFYDTLALRFDANLNPLDAAPITLITGYGVSGLASNGSQFFITWVDQLPPDYIIRVKGARISTDGVVLDGAGLSISGNNQPTAYTTTGVVWDGVYWRVTWGFNNAVSVARVTTGGVVLEPGGVSVPGPMTGPTAGLPGGGVELVWSVASNSQYRRVLGRDSADQHGGPDQDAFDERADADPLGHRDRQARRDDDLAQRYFHGQPDHDSAAGSQRQSQEARPSRSRRATIRAVPARRRSPGTARCILPPGATQPG